MQSLTLRYRIAVAGDGCRCRKKCSAVCVVWSTNILTWQPMQILIRSYAFIPSSICCPLHRHVGASVARVTAGAPHTSLTTQSLCLSSIGKHASEISNTRCPSSLKLDTLYLCTPRLVPQSLPGAARRSGVCACPRQQPSPVRYNVALSPA